MIIHVVKSGDTPWSIAKKYGLTADELLAFNDLDKSDIIVVGQAIIIPSKGEYHTVRSGETLSMIADRYNADLGMLIYNNRIPDPNYIYPGQTLRIPKSTIETNGYITKMGAEGVNVVNTLSKYLTYLAIFSYKILADGNVNEMNDTLVLAASKKDGLASLMTLTNFTESKFDSDLAHTILSNIAVQDKLLANVLKIMKGKGFKGLNIDFEYVFPADRELYNKFLKKAADLMHANGYSISTALAPKTSADEPGFLYGAHDYPVHGKLADFVVLMTYEWGYAGGPPRPIAPINEVKRVLNYAVTVIPRKKIMMGIPLYARDWKLPYTPGTTAETFTNREAVARAAKYKVRIFYNTLYQSPYYNYRDANGISHIVWFEDARSFDSKYKTIKQYNLRGASYWELNLGSRQNWPMLYDNFKIKKL